MAARVRAHRPTITKRLRRTGMALLSGALAGFALVAIPAAPATAHGPGDGGKSEGGDKGSSSVPRFVCQLDVVYSIDGDSAKISRLKPSTGGSSSNGTVDNVGKLNALALPTGGGRYIYAFDREKNEVVRFDADTSKRDVYGLSSNSNAGNVIAGAINPVNGLYYYAAGGSPWQLYAFNTSTGKGIGKVGTISGLGGNGDMAFDAVGNLYVVSNDGSYGAGTLARINAPLPATSGSTALSSTTLATLPGSSGQYAAMAFDGSGHLIVGTGSGKVLTVNPTSGALITTKQASVNLHDLASCSSPSIAVTRVDLPQGRHTSTDQFKVAITGNGITAGNTGTTTGTDSGLQDQPAEIAGPLVVLPGKTYTITQTGQGSTDLGNYTTTWKCLNQDDGTQIASGTGSNGTFEVPGGADSSTSSTVVCTFTNLPLKPAIDLVKTAGAIQDLDGNGPDAGDTITYTFTVTNTGNIKLDPVSVADPKVGDVTCAATSLAAGAWTTCTAAAYPLTQADVDAGKVDNTATATGKGSNGKTVTDTDSRTVTVPARPAIELEKTAGAIQDVDGNGPDAGDTIAYTFTVTNTGNVTLNPVTVADPKVGTVTCPSGPLAPGADVDCTAVPYSLTNADVTAGKVDNIATATGTSPKGTKVTDTDTTTTPIDQVPSIKLVKKAGFITDVDGNGPDAGDTIAYTFTVTNTGNMELDPVSLVDPKLGGAITCPKTRLAAGESMSCPAVTYVLLQSDVDAGTVDNTATVTGTPPTGTPVTDEDSTTTPVTSAPAITLVKTAGAVQDEDGNGDDAGDTIAYAFTVTNTGNVTLDPVSVADPKVGPVTCPSGPLAPGASVDCTAPAYSLSQADVDAGKVDNTATATGTPPSGDPVTDSDSTHTPLSPQAGIKLEKSAGDGWNDVNGNGLDLGDTITYAFTVTNTGSVTLTNINVTDAKVGPVICFTEPLAPGQSRDCDPRNYPLTPGDIDTGKVENTATVTGTTPTGGTVTDKDSEDVDLPATGAIQLVKTAALNDLDGNGADAGDTITYSFRVTNVGKQTLDPVAVHDPMFGSAALDCPTPAGGLAPGAWMDCADETYTIDEDDVSAGKVENTATATGTTPTGDTVQDTDTTTTLVEPSTTNVKVKKTVDDATPQVGDTITYTLEVTNTGAAAAKDVLVTDALPTGVTFVSASPSCERTGSIVRCDVGLVPAGATRTFTIRVKVDPLPTAGADHQHLFDVQKTEVQVDLWGEGDAVSGTVACMDGYFASDGSGRVDHVDQGTGTLADVHMTVNHAVGADAWKATFVNGATGHSTGKVFVVCIKKTSEVVDNHQHDLVFGDVITETVPLTGGVTSVTLTCAAGQTPIQPGWQLDGVAPVVTTYPDDAYGWRFRVTNPSAGGATTGTFTLRCLDNALSTVKGHSHAIGFDEIRKTVTVPAGQKADYRLTCPDNSKGIVAGYDLDPGLVSLGNDPQPITRVFHLYNPTAVPLTAKLYLLCMGLRTEKPDASGKIVNIATVTTSTAETTTDDNSSSATVKVSPAAAPAAKTVALKANSANAPVKCSAGAGACTGTAVLTAAKTQKIRGHLVKKGAVLAKATYKIKAGKKTVLKMKRTKLGKNVLGAKPLKKAKLRIDGKTRIVKLRF